MNKSEETQKLVKRLNIIKGQIEAVSRMIEANDSECIDVFTQIKAIKSGMQKVGQKLIEGRMKECINSKKKVDEKEMEDLLKAMMG